MFSIKPVRFYFYFILSIPLFDIRGLEYDSDQSIDGMIEKINEYRKNFEGADGYIECFFVDKKEKKYSFFFPTNTTLKDFKKELIKNENICFNEKDPLYMNGEKCNKKNLSDFAKKVKYPVFISSKREKNKVGIVIINRELDRDRKEILFIKKNAKLKDSIFDKYYKNGKSLLLLDESLKEISLLKKRRNNEFLLNILGSKNSLCVKTFVGNITDDNRSPLPVIFLENDNGSLNQLFLVTEQYIGFEIKETVRLSSSTFGSFSNVDKKKPLYLNGSEISDHQSFYEFNNLDDYCVLLTTNKKKIGIFIDCTTLLVDKNIKLNDKRLDKFFKIKKSLYIKNKKIERGSQTFLDLIESNYTSYFRTKKVLSFYTLYLEDDEGKIRELFVKELTGRQVKEEAIAYSCFMNFFSKINQGTLLYLNGDKIEDDQNFFNLDSNKVFILTRNKNKIGFRLGPLIQIKNKNIKLDNPFFNSYYKYENSLYIKNKKIERGNQTLLELIKTNGTCHFKTELDSHKSQSIDLRDNKNNGDFFNAESKNEAFTSEVNSSMKFDEASNNRALFNPSSKKKKTKDLYPKFENAPPSSTSIQINESNDDSNKDNDSFFSLKTDDKTLLPKSSGDQRKKKLPSDKNNSTAKKFNLIGVGFALLISIFGAGLYFFKKYEKKRKKRKKKRGKDLTFLGGDNTFFTLMAFICSSILSTPF